MVANIQMKGRISLSKISSNSAMKATKEISELFTPLEGKKDISKAVETILIEGAPGIGKTIIYYLKKFYINGHADTY